MKERKKLAEYTTIMEKKYINNLNKKALGNYVQNWHMRKEWGELNKYKCLAHVAGILAKIS